MQKNQIAQLLKKLDCQMEKAMYSEASRKNNRVIWRMILRHMEEESSPFNTNSIREVVKKYYGDECGRPLTKGFANYFRSAELLCEFITTGKLSRKCKVRALPVKCEIVDELKNFMLNTRKNSFRTVAAHNYIWQKLAAYAKEHSYSSFERCWVMPYLYNKYGITNGKLPHKKCCIRRAAEILCDYSLSGTMLRRRYTKGTDFSSEFTVLLAALDEYRNLHQLAESTYINMRSTLRGFAAFMQANYGPLKNY